MSEGHECAARRQGTAGGNDPADCDWPFCGCDAQADRVITALQESGYGPLHDISTARALEVVLSRCKMDNETARILKYLLASERAKHAGS